MDMATGSGAGASSVHVGVATVVKGSPKSTWFSASGLESIGAIALMAAKKLISSRFDDEAALELRPMAGVDTAAAAVASLESFATVAPLQNGIPLSTEEGRVVVGDMKWFRLDVIDASVPQAGKYNPHTRDAGARAWRETETPLRFRRPLVRRRRRPLSLTLPPLPPLRRPLSVSQPRPPPWEQGLR